MQNYIGLKCLRKPSFFPVTNIHLSWKDHIDTIQTRVNKQLAVLRRVKHLLTEKARKLVVCTVIVPILDYGNLVWGDWNNKTLTDSLQLLQHKAAKIVFNRSLHSSAAEAMIIFNWKPLNIRRKFLRCTYVHKCINNITELMCIATTLAINLTYVPTKLRVIQVFILRSIF